MNVACSSATFGIKTAADFVAAGSARAVLMVNPEICSGHLNFRDRDSHFIFGDVATAVIVEAAEDRPRRLGHPRHAAEDPVLQQHPQQFRLPEPRARRRAHRATADKLFVQEGRKVFREVVPMVSAMILEHAADLGHRRRPV